MSRNWTLAMNSDCRRWIQLSDLNALGETLASADRDFLRTHAASCSDCATEAAVWRGLKLPNVQQDPEEHDVGRTLSLIAATGPQEVRTHRRARRSVVAASATLACAAAFVLWIRSAPERSDARTQSSSQPDFAELIVPPSRSSALADPVVAAPSASSMPAAQAGTPSCSEWSADVHVCLAEGTAIGPRVANAEPRLTLVRGRAAAQLSLAETDAAFAIEAPGAIVTGRRATFSVEVLPDGSSVARVIDGTVTLRGTRDAPSTARAVNAGESYRFGENAPRRLTDRERSADRALLRPRHERERTSILR